MSPAKDDGLTLQEAAALDDRTTKTLYRRMEKGALSFHLNEAPETALNFGWLRIFLSSSK